MSSTRRSTIAAGLAAAGLLAIQAPAVHAASADKLTFEGHAALDRLYATSPRSRLFANHALGVLIFPHIIKGGLVFGAQSGNGVLFVAGKVAGFYNISAASFGLQAGGQAFSSAIFFMNGRALSYLHRSGGWAIGTAPNIVVVDTGAAADANSTTMTQDVYIFPFAQKGLMAGIDIHASKITPIHPD
jgi:lipid-binding SYLF domain-containing protein